MPRFTRRKGSRSKTTVLDVNREYIERKDVERMRELILKEVIQNPLPKKGDAEKVLGGLMSRVIEKSNPKIKLLNKKDGPPRKLESIYLGWKSSDKLYTSLVYVFRAETAKEALWRIAEEISEQKEEIEKLPNEEATNEEEIDEENVTNGENMSYLEMTDKELSEIASNSESLSSSTSSLNSSGGRFKLFDLSESEYSEIELNPEMFDPS